MWYELPVGLGAAGLTPLLKVAGGDCRGHAIQRRHQHVSCDNRNVPAGVQHTPPVSSDRDGGGPFDRRLAAVFQR